MLESLTICNYAIIHELTVEFSEGLNVITGETGAGKSIVVDAFELALGARASGDMIRSGADNMSVSGLFNINDSPLMDNIPFETYNGILILRRDIRADGSGRCFINDRPVTLRAMKELGNLLVDLHGQHDHQSLLDVSGHVSFLDSYGGFSSLAKEVKELFNEMVNIVREISELTLKIKNFNRDRELYLFQIKEIEDAKIAPDEDVLLENDIQRLARAEELKALGWEVFQKLSEAEGSVGDRIGEIASRIGHLSKYDTELFQFMEKIEEFSLGIKDLANELRDYAEKIDDDPARLAGMEERLALIERIKKKYGPGLDDVFSYLEKIKKKTGGAEESDAQLADLALRKKEIESLLADRALKLSNKRKEIAPLLSKEVETHLSELGMSGARLVVAIDRFEGADTLNIDDSLVPVGEDGFDRVEFMFSANPGEPPKPLVKIASGGEVSRVMLALKLALTDAASVPTMVFDEIDIGVSGRIAEAVGKKMLQLSENRQVLTITHLPQIAVMADRHFSARKSIEKGRTQTELVLLDEGARQKELASLLSGETLTDTALAHAKKLMDKAGNKK